jgi:hypothetical protein
VALVLGILGSLVVGATGHAVAQDDNYAGRT